MMTVRTFEMIDPPSAISTQDYFTSVLKTIKSKETVWNTRHVMFLYAGRVDLYIGPGRVATAGQR